MGALLSLLGTAFLCLRDFIGLVTNYYTRLHWLDARFASSKQELVRVDFPGLPRAYITRSPAVIEFALKSDFTNFDKVRGGGVPARAPLAVRPRPHSCLLCGSCW